MAQEPVTAPPADAFHPVVNLGARLRSVRTRSGLSLREVARQLGVSPSFVSQLETGKSQPSVATLYSLAQLLDVPIDELFAAADATDDGTDDGTADGTDNGADNGTYGGADDGADDGGVSDQLDGRIGEALDDPAGHMTGRAAGRASGPTSRATPIRALRAAHPPVPEDPAPPSRSHGGDRWSREQDLPRLSVVRPDERARIVMDSGVIWEQLAANTGHGLDFMEVIYPPGSSSTNDDRMLRHNGYEFGYLLTGELEVTVGFDTFVLRAGESFGLDSTVPHKFTNRGRVPARGIWTVHHRHD